MPNTPAPPSPPLVRRLALWLAGLAAFFTLVTANSGGYRFGVSDQAFYIPAIHRALVPHSFPRDTALLAPQSSLLAWDQLVATLVSATGLRLETVFFAAYCLAVVAFFAGVVAVAAPIYREPLSTWALLAALTLRHRVAKTGVNTFEGYFHPRVLAFGLGTLAIGLLIHRRRPAAAALVAVAFFVHPTTALWFAVWVAFALAIDTGRWRWLLALAGAAAIAGAALVLIGPLGQAAAIMDAPWTDALTEKDYLFPTAWSLDTWAVNAIAPAVLCAAFAWRRRLDRSPPGTTSAPSSPATTARAPGAAAGGVRSFTTERAIVLGCLALVLVFAASLPFIAARVALAVQLQTSRVLWQVELVATVYLVWLLIEAPWPAVRLSVRARALIVLAVLAAAASGRGYYVLAVEHDRALVALDLAPSPWQRVTRWVEENTPVGAHFLVDPGHAWKLDSSFRVAARRDVLLEAVKDAAMATYSRDSALRVTERLSAIGDFGTLDEDRARALAKRYQLDYLIAEQPLRLPLVHTEGPFHVYALGQGAQPGDPPPDRPSQGAPSQTAPPTGAR